VLLEMDDALIAVPKKRHGSEDPPLQFLVIALKRVGVPTNLFATKS
jgi:hypothetical protein